MKSPTTPSMLQAARGLFAALAFACALAVPARAVQVHQLYDRLFDGRTGAYHTYRIPSLARATNGVLLAFAEGRVNNNTDWGDIDIVCKRSLDNGVTWSALAVVVGTGSADSWTNPTVVTDATTGRVWLFLNGHSGAYTSISQIDAWGKRRVYACYSDDYGVTWSAPQDLTTTLLPANYTWDAMGPGIGIQTTQAFAGRLIVPAQGRNIYSDDHGATWQYRICSTDKVEATVVELTDGRLMRNDRPGSTQDVFRYVFRGTIEGGFSAPTADPNLMDPRCEASILRYNMDAPNRIFFLNSDSDISRGVMTVKITYDGGVTWPMSRRLYDWLTIDQAISQGKGGYTSLIKTADNLVGALVETNEDTTNNATSHRSLDFHRINIEWATSGQPEPGVTDTQPPTAPTNLASTAKTDTSVSLAWTASTDNVGVTGYDVYNGAALAGSTAATTFTVTGLAPSTSYTFTVKAKDAAGNVSAASSAVIVATAAPSLPAAPTNLTATAFRRKVTIAWTDNATTETGFKIESSLDGVAFSQIVTVAANTTTYTNTGLNSGTTYYYRVRATSAAGDSAYSNTASAVAK